MVISSSKTMTVTQQVTAQHEKKITPAAGITFQQTQHGEDMIAVCPRYKNHQIQEKLALASVKKKIIYLSIWDNTCGSAKVYVKYSSVYLFVFID